LAEPGVLITRPEPGATETAQRVAALGWRPVLAPALVLASRPFAMPPAAQAVLLPSRAAARSLPVAAFPPAVPVLAVGEGTAAEARSHGFVNILAADGDAVSLAGLAASTLDPAAGPLLLAAGTGNGQALAQALRTLGFRVIRRVVYAATPAATLPEAARLALGQGEVSAALFFSPHSARCAIALLDSAGLAATAASTMALAISARVAEAAVQMIAPLSWRAVRVAERPDQDSMLQLLGPR
jgi:uroporphyrinogen-III synthase